MADPQTWYIARGGNRHGPLTPQEFAKLVQLGHLNEADLVWHEQLDEWVPATRYLQKPAQPKALAEHELLTRPQPTAAPATTKVKGRRMREYVWWGIGGAFLVAIIALEPQAALYRLSGAINGAVFGAIGGGLAATVEFLIRRSFTAKYATIGVLLGFAFAQVADKGIGHLGDQFYETKVRGQVDQIEVRKVLNKTPLFSRLAEVDPESYARLVADVAGSIRSTDGGDAIHNIARDFMIAFRQRNVEQITSASPFALTEIGRSLHSMLVYLQKLDVALCREYILVGIGAPRMGAVTARQDFQQLMQANALAVVNAAGEGKRLKRNYGALNDGDVEFVVRRLEKNGWTLEMQETLGSVDRLKQLPAAGLCELFTEWMRALITIENEEIRARWMREVLTPILRS
jgi:hypothetical protein